MILATHQSSLQPAAGRRRVLPQTLSVAYTPDSDDAFNYYAWEHGRIDTGDTRTTFHRNHIIALNNAAIAGEFDVVATSSVVYPQLSDQYRILAVGNSVGRGYGPVLVSREVFGLADLAGRRVGVGGHLTTGSVLAAMACNGAQLVPMQFDKIADAVVAGELDAGVMIHEELLFFPQKGLRKVMDLGEWWCDTTGLPLPVGLNLVHRRLGRDGARAIARMASDSMRFARDHFDEAFAYASTFGRGCAADHVAMFSNDDTLRLPADVREAIGVMCDRVVELGLATTRPAIEVVDED